MRPFSLFLALFLGFFGCVSRPPALQAMLGKPVSIADDPFATQ